MSKNWSEREKKRDEIHEHELTESNSKNQHSKVNLRRRTHIRI